MQYIIHKIKTGHSRTAKASRQVIYSFFFQSVNIIVGMLYVPMLLNYLTQEKYGIWLTITSVVGWFSFFDIGLGNGLRNKLTEAITLGRLDLAKKYVSTTYALITITFGVILMTFFVLNQYINWNSLLNTDSLSGRELSEISSVIFTFFILRFIVQLIGVIYIADHLPAVNNGVLAVASFLSLISVFILTRQSVSGNLLALSTIITALPVILFLLLSAYAFSGSYRYLKPSFKAIDFGIRKELTGLGLSFFIMQITAVILYSTSSFFISQFYGANEVVVYNIVFKYFQLPVMLYSIILTPLWSSVTNAYTSGDYIWLKKTMNRLERLSYLLISGIILMALISEKVYSLWVGKKIDVPIEITLTMALYAAMNIFIAPYSNFINGTGKLRLTLVFSFVGIIVYFICIFFLARKFSNGTGVLISVLVPYCLFAIIQPYQSRKLLNREANGLLNV